MVFEMIIGKSKWRLPVETKHHVNKRAIYIFVSIECHRLIFESGLLNPLKRKVLTETGFGRRLYCLANRSRSSDDQTDDEHKNAC